MDPDATGQAPTASSDPLETIVDTIAQQIGDIAKAEGDSKAKMKQIAELLKKQEKIMALLGKQADAEGESEPAAEGLRRQLELTTRRIEQYELAEQKRAQEQAVCQELAAVGLDRTNKLHVSPVFESQLLACKTPAERKSLIDDRLAVVKAAGGSSARPVSTAVNAMESTSPPNPVDFAKRIRG